MNLWLAISVRSPAESKSRLAPVLDDASRIALSIRLYSHVLSIAIEAMTPRRVAVVSAEPIILQTARELDAHVVRESGRGQNAALAEVANYCRCAGATAILTLSSDLPFLNQADLHALIRSGRSHDVVLAADRHGYGTNAILQRPIGRLVFSHGPNSLGRHIASAREGGASVDVVHRDGTAWDLDTPTDLAEFVRRGRFDDRVPLHRDRPPDRLPAKPVSSS